MKPKLSRSWTWVLAFVCAVVAPQGLRGGEQNGELKPARTRTAQVLVAYYSLTGNTEKMAVGVVEGARRVPGAVVHLKKVDEVSPADLAAADAIILGGPTYYANLPGKMKAVLDDWAWKMKVDFTDKIGGAFATGGGQVGGKEHVVMSLLMYLLSNRMIVAGPLYQNPQTGSVWGEVGSAAMTGPLDPGVSEGELDSARLLGERVARLAAARATAALAGSPASAPTTADRLERETLDEWAAPYRGWRYQPEHVIPAEPRIPGFEKFHNPDCPCVYQLPGQPEKWFMSFIAFDGHGYNSFVAQSTNLVQWTQPRLAMGFGPTNEFDFGGCVVGAFLYEAYEVKAPRVLARRDGKFWTLYGCYPRQGGYELRPGAEGVACSEDGLSWQRAKNTPTLSVHDADCGAWEKDCVYQPWLVADRGRFFDFYNAANGGAEQTGLAFSTDLLNWMRFPANPVVRNRAGGYDAQFASDPKVFRDGDHWVMFYFGVGRGGAHIMAAFSRDLIHWTAHPEPLYAAGGNPSGLDKQYAHKISLVYNPRNDTCYLFYCACGDRGRGIGLITSKPL